MKLSKGRKQTGEELCKEEIYERKFPVLAVIVLLFSLTWLLSEIGYLNINIPWIPPILIVVSIGWIVNRYS